VPDDRDASPRAWMLPWLRVNLLLREMTRLVVRVDRDARRVPQARAEQGHLDAGEVEARVVVELTRGPLERCRSGSRALP
jgi:hypothetical protein